jgi:hypothetical protein
VVYFFIMSHNQQLNEVIAQIIAPMIGPICEAFQPEIDRRVREYLEKKGAQCAPLKPLLALASTLEQPTLEQPTLEQPTLEQPTLEQPTNYIEAESVLEVQTLGVPKGHVVPLSRTGAAFGVLQLLQGWFMMPDDCQDAIEGEKEEEQEKEKEQEEEEEEEEEQQPEPMQLDYDEQVQEFPLEEVQEVPLEEVQEFPLEEVQEFPLEEVQEVSSDPEEIQVEEEGFSTPSSSSSSSDDEEYSPEKRPREEQEEEELVFEEELLQGFRKRKSIRVETIYQKQGPSRQRGGTAPFPKGKIGNILRVPLFHVGQELEGMDKECYDFPMHIDVINRVRVLNFNPENGEYEVQLLAYGPGDQAYFHENELDLPREGGLDTPKGGWKVGDQVEIRLRNRRGIDCDGVEQDTWDLLDADRGVWVYNARIADRFDNNKNKYIVEHTKWDYRNKSRGRCYSVVYAEDIRRGRGAPPQTP